MSAPENPSAFPVNADNLGGAGAYAPEPGMTLRDWFAGQAVHRPDVKFASLFSHRWASRLSYYVADTMLAARTNPGGREGGRDA